MSHRALAEALASLRSPEPVRDLVRRCILHHLPLDGLVCPMGHGAEGAGERPQAYSEGHVWELYDVTACVVIAFVRGDFSVEWLEDANAAGGLTPQLAGRDGNGLLGGGEVWIRHRTPDRPRRSGRHTGVRRPRE